MADLSGYRCLIAVNHLSDIPENLEITFGDISISVLIQLERWGRENDTGRGNPPPPHNEVQEGPWGGPGGSTFETGVVSNFTVVFDGYIKAIDFSPVNKSKETPTPVHDSNISHALINFQPGEYLTGLQGTLDKKGAKYVVRSLTFFTNFTHYGPFGYEKGDPFSFQSTGKRIIGLFGREEQPINAAEQPTINAIGICVEI
uniref:Jacalin-type lectin domain-containing protein n=1 Tax=Ananas comosus var. bracteatus TaxID=296719 RepID=A0A6V7NII1_ANACO|nr:unnamed protein product [Ananas comosus var. bracteatus]